MAFTNDETETLQALVRSCLLEINRLKTDLAASEKERFDLESEKVQIAHDETINELNAQLSKKDNDFAIYRNDVQDKIDDLKSELFEKTEELNVKNKIIMDNENLISNQDEKIRKLSDFDANIKSVRTAIEDDISSIKSSLEPPSLETFTCLAFLSDGQKIIKPKKLSMLPYFLKEELYEKK